LRGRAGLEVSSKQEAQSQREERLFLACDGVGDNRTGGGEWSNESTSKSQGKPDKNTKIVGHSQPPHRLWLVSFSPKQLDLYFTSDNRRRMTVRSTTRSSQGELVRVA